MAIYFAWQIVIKCNFKQHVRCISIASRIFCPVDCNVVFPVQALLMSELSS